MGFGDEDIPTFFADFYVDVTIGAAPVPLTLTMGVSTDDPITNYGFSLFDEGVTGYPGAPFGAVSPTTIDGAAIVYLAFGPSGTGFVFYLYLMAAQSAEDSFETLVLTDDDSAVWTFARTSADVPAGQVFTFGADDVRAWQWTVDPSALPVVTAGQDYVLSVGSGQVAAKGILDDVEDLGLEGEYGNATPVGIHTVLIALDALPGLAIGSEITVDGEDMVVRRRLKVQDGKLERLWCREAT